MTRDQAISKVRKLRALAAGAPGRAEAETAWGKAFELMQEHGLSNIDIDPPAPKPQPAPSPRHEKVMPIPTFGPSPQFQVLINGLIADLVTEFRRELGLKAQRRRRA